jgi:hypothetical protein
MAKQSDLRKDVRKEKESEEKEPRSSSIKPEARPTKATVTLSVDDFMEESSYLNERRGSCRKPAFRFWLFQIKKERRTLSLPTNEWQVLLKQFLNTEVK